MSSDHEQLLKYVSKHFPDHQVSTSFEAGYCGYYAHRCFESYGWVP
jgi:transposase